MNPLKTESQLFELLSRTINELEKIEDNPSTLNFIARRVGNIVKHMKDLRDDLQPRGHQNGGVQPAGVPKPGVGPQTPR
jgi:chaperonin cofactor prefoldin